VEYIVWNDTGTQLAGTSGIGGYSMPSGNSISLVELGPCDRTGPGAIDPKSGETYLHTGEVDIETAGAQDTGVGVGEYLLSRDGTLIQTANTPEFSDAGATPGTSHTYSIRAVDFHGNVSASESFSIAVPATSVVDPLETGVRPTGSYWGAKGEKIDVRSGNLNYSYPLVKAISRRWSIPLVLSYNSQNWRLDNAGNPWRLGQSIGVGFAWTMQVGSLTAFYSDLLSVKFYLFSDASGANYRLDQNNNGVWTSKESVYVSYDSNRQRLEFNNGSHWIMGCISAGLEQDAGTMYPTLLEDSNGNQVAIHYANGMGVSWVDSSARMTSIQDVRTAVNPKGNTTFTFAYQTGTNNIPRLTKVTNAINSQDSFTLSYTSTVLSDPFGKGVSFGWFDVLNGITNDATSLTTQFTYDTVSAGELVQVTFPFGGHIRWQYGTAAYSQTALREVTNRYLQWDSTGEREYTLTAVPNNNNTLEINRTLKDLQASGGAAKTWVFNDVGTSPGSGMLNMLVESASAEVILRASYYTWAADPGGNTYISRLQTDLDPGKPSQVTKQVDQTVDQYGNVTQTKLYDYSDLTNPARTYNTAYLTTQGSTDYTKLYIRNRPLKTTVTDKSGHTTTLKQNTYDQYPNGITQAPGIDQHDSVGYGTSYTTRGNVYDEAVPWGSWHHNYDETGAVLWTGNDVNPNHYVQQITSTATNYAVPDRITTADSLNTDYAWEASLNKLSETGPNQDQSTIQYDSADRPQNATSPYGAKTVYQYSTGAPQVIATTNSHWVKTYLDGLGRPAKIEKGDGSGTQSVQDFVYDACGCSPTGKITKRSLPYASGGTPAWTVYAYDAIGRLKTRTRPDGHSAYSYSYSGNNTTVTDPTGKWKTFTTDAFGQLVQVQEPTPNSGTEPNHVTLYTYDVFGHLTQVRMDRTVGGSVKTQYRTWAYDPTTLRLMSKTSPESGTVSYTYNADGTLATVTDAKNQRRVYSYDNYGRITHIQRGTWNGSTFTEDTTQRTNYVYSGTNGGFSSATAGRVSQITYTGPHGIAYKEWYSYHKGGGVTAKRLNLTGTPFGSSSLNLDATYGYDSEGNITSTHYPNTQFNSNNTTVAGPSYTYGYDTMERLQTMTDGTTRWVTNATYGPANQILTMSAYGFDESRTYNANNELIELASGPNVHYKYNYSGTQDNGQILSQTDVISGETITYQYDTLQRLIKASGTGDPSGAWSQAFGYDGFGNLSQITGSNAGALSLAIDTNTNRIQTSASYDANGNMTGYSGSGYAYDIENRLKQANPESGGTFLYGYDSTNHRVYKAAYSGSAYSAEEIYFYGADGHKNGTWQINPSSGVLLKASVTKQWFGGRLVSPEDRIASRGKYFPFGQERYNPNPPNPPNDQEKFASYTRDSASGLDYAGQRYYSNLIGRFIQPDPFGQSADANVPQSWNRYAYVGNDPANSFDPEGLDPILASDYQDWYLMGLGEGGTDGAGLGESCTLCIDTSSLPAPSGPPQLNSGDAPNGTVNQSIYDGTALINVTTTCPPNCGSVMGNIDQGAQSLANFLDPIANNPVSNLITQAGSIVFPFTGAGVSITGNLLPPVPYNNNPWSGDITSTTASGDFIAYRVWGGASGQTGAWLTTTAPSSSSQAIQSLSLPPGNTAQFV
jgi:RHS repeat-associated protein